MEIRLTPRVLEDFQTLAKKAAHKYAMRIVVSPLAHKQAVSDIEQAFYAGAMEYREVMDTYRTTRKLSPHLDVIKKQAFDKFFDENFGYHLSKEAKKTCMIDVEKGIGWAVDNDSTEKS